MCKMHCSRLQSKVCPVQLKPFGRTGNTDDCDLPYKTHRQADTHLHQKSLMLTTSTLYAYTTSTLYTSDGWQKSCLMYGRDVTSNQSIILTISFTDGSVAAWKVELQLFLIESKWADQPDRLTIYFESAPCGQWDPSTNVYSVNVVLL